MGAAVATEAVAVELVAGGWAGETAAEEASGVNWVAAEAAAAVMVAMVAAEVVTVCWVELEATEEEEEEEVAKRILNGGCKYPKPE